MKSLVWHIRNVGVNHLIILIGVMEKFHCKHCLNVCLLPSNNEQPFFAKTTKVRFIWFSRYPCNKHVCVCTCWCCFYLSIVLVCICFLTKSCRNIATSCQKTHVLSEVLLFFCKIVPMWSCPILSRPDQDLSRKTNSYWMGPLLCLFFRSYIFSLFKQNLCFS